MLQNSSILVDLEPFTKIVFASTAAQRIISQKGKSIDEVRKQLSEVFQPFIQTKGCRYFLLDQYGIESQQFLSVLVNLTLGKKEEDDEMTSVAKNLLTKINEPEVKNFLTQLENKGKELVSLAAAKALKSLPRQATLSSVVVCFAPGGPLLGYCGRYSEDPEERMVGINPLFVYRESDGTFIDLVCHELYHAGIDGLRLPRGTLRHQVLVAAMLGEGGATYAMLPFSDEHWFSQQYAKGAQNVDNLIERFGECLMEIPTLSVDEWERKMRSEWTTRPSKGQLPPLYIVGSKMLERIEKAFSKKKVRDVMSLGCVAFLRAYNQAATRLGGYRFPDNLLNELSKEEKNRT